MCGTPPSPLPHPSLTPPSGTPDSISMAQERVQWLLGLRQKLSAMRSTDNDLAAKAMLAVRDAANAVDDILAPADPGDPTGSNAVIANQVTLASPAPTHPYTSPSPPPPFPPPPPLRLPSFRPPPHPPPPSSSPPLSSLSHHPTDGVVPRLRTLTAQRARRHDEPGSPHLDAPLK